ncbi:MAG: DNA repair protein RecN [Deltaproteobacteria bacterium]|nr:DNA repair protein RecN [Deltaproteobacteria bacterium]
MFQEISIQNFGLIEKIILDFHEGFHAISGETGAGKSILLQAIAFALGSRVDKDCLRSGCDEAVVTLVFEMPPKSDLQQFMQEKALDEAGLNTVILRRHFSSSGRSRAYVNDQNVSLKIIQEIGEKLCNQVGQHAAQKLLKNDYLLSLLDQMGGHLPLVQEYQDAYRDYKQILKQVEALEERVRQVKEQEDFLRFQYQELDAAELRVGEQEELESLKQRLKNSANLHDTSYKMLRLLAEDEDSLTEQISKLQVLDKKLFQWEETSLPWGEQINELAEQSQELIQHIQHYHANLPSPEQDLDTIESRLDLLQRLQKKYRLGIEELIQKHQQLKVQLDECEDFDYLLKEHQARIQQSKEDLLEKAQKLTKTRQKTAEKITHQLVQSLEALAMPQTRVNWKFDLYQKIEDFHERGGESMCFELSFNPGEPLKALEQVASGGELSRLLLALYEILFHKKSAAVLIFDEVDTGVGGKVAELIGQKLQSLGKKSQVIAVTHLPQIASLAKWHYLVSKKVQNKRTISEISLLDGEERLQEIARMLAGVRITAQALENARQLLGEFAA